MSELKGKPRKKLAIVVSHPIQHFVYFYRAIATLDDIELKVIFCSKIGLNSYYDKDMGENIRWADDLTSGFSHEFLPESESITSVSFASVNNPSLSGVLDEFKPDAIVVYGYAQLTQLRALFWCRRSGVPALMITDTNAVTQRSPVKAFVRSLVLKRLFAQVSGFLTVGDQNERALEQMGVPRRKMHRTPFTIDEHRYRMAREERAERRAKIRAAFGIADDAFLGLFVGKLIARKRAMDVVRAIRDAAVGNDRLHVLICGNGPDFEEMDRVARQDARVSLAGFVNTDRLPDFFCAADVLIHPAEHDPHPLICSEAAAIGLPMILSDKVGTIGESDISRAGENTLVYPCGDIGALTDSVARLSSDPARLGSMSANSLRIFEDCSLQTSLAGLQSALQSVTGRKDRA